MCSYVYFGPPIFIVSLSILDIPLYLLYYQLSIAQSEQVSKLIVILLYMYKLKVFQKFMPS